jgi:hypothetical protein
VAALLRDVIPILKRFRSSVVRDVQFELRPSPRDPVGDPVFDDNAFFAARDHPFEGVPLAFGFAVRVPALPRFHDAYADGVVVLGGADVQGRGLVPLGLGAGVNTGTIDEQVDVQGELPGPGLVLARMAPAHHGLEGSPYVLSTVAVSLKSLNDASVGVALSGLFDRLPGDRLSFDPRGTQPVPLSGDFLSFPEGAGYNFLDIPGTALGARTFQLSGGADLSSAQVVRVQFTDRAGRRWQVIADPATAAAGFVLPKPPTGSLHADRTFYGGSSIGERSPLLVQALRLRRGGAAIGFQQLVELNGTNADRLADVMAAVSIVDYGRPEISWTSAVPANNTLAAGSAVTLAVRGFRVGTAVTDDGVVKISFAGGTGCPEITIEQDPSMGKGELSANLPTSCTGTGVEMAAQLYDNQGQPVAPVVRAEFPAVNIQ